MGRLGARTVNFACQNDRFELFSASGPPGSRLGARTVNFACQNGRFEPFSASGAPWAAWAPEPSSLLARMALRTIFGFGVSSGRLAAKTVNFAFQKISFGLFSTSGKQSRLFLLSERRFGSFSVSGGPRATWAPKKRWGAHTKSRAQQRTRHCCRFSCHSVAMLGRLGCVRKGRAKRGQCLPTA